MAVDAHDGWIRGIERATPLLDTEKEAMRKTPLQVRTIEGHVDVVRDGERPTQCCIVVEGLCWRYKMTPNGSRQVLSLHIPGEMPDLQSLHLSLMDHTLGTVTRTRMAFCAHQNLRELVRRFPRLSDAFWRYTLLDAAIFRQWLIGLGARTAYQRIAHLICEMAIRQGSKDLVTLPLTQAELGDAVGLSAVHVNRSLRDLREAGLAVLDRGVVQVLNFDGLKTVGDFDPSYLQLEYVERS